MPRIFKIALFHALVVLLGFDAHAIAQRFLQASRDPIDWPKAMGALLLQAAALGLAAAYLAFLGSRREPQSALHTSPLASWRLKVLPLVALSVAGALSVSLLYNSMICGDRPFPSARGVPMCGR